MPNIRKKISKKAKKIYKKAKKIYKKGSRSNNSYKNKKLALKSKKIKKLIKLKLIDEKQVLELSGNQIRNLKNKYIFEMVSGGRCENKYISISEALGLSPRQVNILSDQSARMRFERSQMHNLSYSLEDFFQEEENINYNESTHNNSVHAGVSESVRKLSVRYGTKVYRGKLDKIIIQLRLEIVSFFAQNTDKFSFDILKSTIALRCYDRVSAANYNFFDSSSGVSFRQLLGLFFIAIKDNNNRIGSYQDALSQLVEGLLEIQLGDGLDPLKESIVGNYSDSSNLDAIFANEDFIDHDDPICRGGSFNKLIEKLQGVHPDCELRFITSGTASLKLPVIVKEELNSYLAAIFDSKTMENFEEILDKIESDGVEAIWGEIKKQVSDRVFSEFSVVYPDRSSKNFKDFIKNGLYLDTDSIVAEFREKNRAKNRAQKQGNKNSDTNIINTRDSACAFREVAEQLNECAQGESVDC